MRIVLIGDSITFGDNASDYKRSWAGLLEDYLKKNGRKVEVINNAAEGETAGDGLQRVEKDVISLMPDLVFIGYGTNDCTKEAGKYVNNIYNYESNIREITGAIRDQANANIIFSLSPPVIENICNDDVVNLHNRDIEAYNNICKRLCGSLELSFVDHFSLMKDMDLSVLLDSDGIHPNDKGHSVMFGNILSSAGHYFRG